MAVLPTGYGKSLPYQMYLPLIRRLKMEEESVFKPSTREMLTNLDSSEKVIVCSPLVALMEDQVKRLSSIPNVQAVYKGKRYPTPPLKELMN